MSNNSHTANAAYEPVSTTATPPGAGNVGLIETAYKKWTAARKAEGTTDTDSERLLDIEDHAVWAVIETPAKTKTEVEIKFETLQYYLEQCSGFSDERHVELYRSVREDVQRMLA